MTLLSVIGTIFHYITLPFATLLRWIFGSLLVALAPVIYLGHYILSGMLLPLRLVAKFETLYIYLGVAAVIGLITGSILHVASTLLVSIFNLTPIPEEKGRSAASVRVAREQKKLDAWQNSAVKLEHRKRRGDGTMEKKYAEWLEMDVGKRKEDQGLLGQTIIEEDDDSEDGF